MVRRALLVACFALIAFAPAGAAAAPSTGDLTRVSWGYRWERGDLSAELRDRGSRWSKAEADAVAAALDLLPDVLLRRAFVDVRVRTFFRDPHPVGRSGERPPNVSATTAVDRGFMSCGDRLFAGLDHARIYATVTHEIGHCAQYAVVGGGPLVGFAKVRALGTPGWTGISWTSILTRGRKSWNGFVSDYARSKNDREDFAETVEFYWLAPAELLRTNPRKYAYMRDVVFEGAVSPRAARLAGHVAIERVGPEVTRLGSTRANNLSLVRVHGRHFMGPLDGGFNRVTYGGRRALHLAVSRSSVISWVPAGGNGSAPVVVTTQDGRSAPAAFTISRPWWKFW